MLHEQQVRNYILIGVYLQGALGGVRSMKLYQYHDINWI